MRPVLPTAPPDLHPPHRPGGPNRLGYRADMPVRAVRRESGRSAERAPVEPKRPASLDLATVEEHDLDHEATFRRLGFVDLDLSGRSADAVEFEQCRLRGTDLSGATLDGAKFSDCLVESSNLANLRVEKSTLLRVRVSTARMTGVHWVNGSLRDVTFSQCRLDLASFRFSNFRHVVFEGCNLSRADFTNADLGGVRFTDCDLTGAQFSHAKLPGTRFVNCSLAGIGGVTSLAGAIVARADLIALSYTLAGALGIRIEDEDADPDAERT